MRKLWRKLKILFYDSFLFIIIYELLEESLEEAIAYVVVDAFSGIISKIFCISITQSIKYVIKKTVKMCVYQKGDDKVKFFKKLLYCIYFNKCTIMMVLLSAFSAYSAYLLISVDLWIKILIACAIMASGILCAINIGYEKYDQIKERLEKSKEIKEQKNILKKQLKEQKTKDKSILKIAKVLKEQKLKELKEKEKIELENIDKQVNEEAELKYADGIKQIDAEKAIVEASKNI